MGSDDERDVVRRGYNVLSYHYRSDDAEDGQYAPWLADLHRRLPPSAAVLDLGCGCGVPVARFLAQAGHRVTGVDLSEVQLLATAGHEAWTGTEDNWLDGPAAMWWSHADASTYRSWLRQTGLTISSEEFVPEGASGHTLFWAQRPPS